MSFKYKLSGLLGVCYLLDKLKRQKPLFSFHDLPANSQKQILKTKTDTFVWGNGYINNTYVYKNFHPHRIRSFMNMEGKEILPNTVIDVSFHEHLAAVIDNDCNLFVFLEPKLNAEKDSNINNHVRAKVKQLCVSEKLKVIQAKFTKDKLFVLTKDNKVFFFNLEIVFPKVDEFFATAVPEPEVNVNDKPVHVKELKSIVQIATGKDHFLALDNKGMVFGMGDDSFGQLGQGNFSKERELQMKIYNNFIERRERLPVKILIPEPVSKLVCGDNHSLVLTNSNNVYGFGYNRFLQLSNDALYRKQVLGLNQPTVITQDKFNGMKVVDIAASKNCSFFVCFNAFDKTFHFFSAGEGLRGTLGQNLIKHMSDVELMPDISGLINAENLKPFEPQKLACGNNHCLLLFKNPRIIYVWGNNEYGELGTTDRVFYESPVPILEEYNLPYKILNVAAGFKNSAFICEKVDKAAKNQILERDKQMYEEERNKRRKKKKDVGAEGNNANAETAKQKETERPKEEGIFRKFYKNLRKYI